MRLVPHSSFWRTVLLMWLVVLVSQAAVLTVAVYYLYFPSVKQSANLALLEIDTLKAADELAGRAEILAALQRDHGHTVTDDMNLVPPEKNYPFASVFLGPMQDYLGEDVSLRVAFAPQPGIWMTHEKLDGIWIRYPLHNIGEYEGLIILAWSVGTPALAFLAAALFVRQLNRPLKELERAAKRIGRGESVSKLNIESGPQEIIALNKAFNQMRKGLSQATRERALLLAGISHDLRTPLTRMRLTVELLGGSDPELTDGIIRDIEDMNAILDQFIAFIRDGNEEATEVGDLNEVIKEVVVQHEADGVVIASELSELPEISLKRLSLKRMFTNLIGNAVRHGGGKVDVLSEVHDGEIRVLVGDRGPGLTEKEMYELFQPFARGDESRGTKGSGLGLAIAKRIVEMHHGRIELRNREGGGLESVVYLPVTGEFLPPESMLAGMR